MTLIDRLSKLDGPDREVDGEIMQTFDPDLWAKAYILSQEPCGCSKEMATEEAKWRAPRYTASLDAAIALAERVLPGYSRIMWEHPGECHVDMFKLGELQKLPDGRLHKERYNLVQVEQAPTLAIALLIALLRAKEASHGE